MPRQKHRATPRRTYLLIDRARGAAISLPRARPDDDPSPANRANDSPRYAGCALTLHTTSPPLVFNYLFGGRAGRAVKWLTRAAAALGGLRFLPPTASICERERESCTYLYTACTSTMLPESALRESSSLLYKYIRARRVERFFWARARPR